MATIVTSGTNIWTERGGEGDGPTLVLLHGLGANGSVWDEVMPLVKANWPGQWLNLDLRGHGRSGHAGPYGYACYAADVAAAVGGQDKVISIIGHSMGGVVALALATGWFGVKVDRALTFGMKIAWTPDEVAKMKQLGSAPVRWFDKKEEAIDRYLKVSGLIGLVPADSNRADVGIHGESERFRLASDPAISAAAGPAVEPFFAAAKASGARLRIAAGEGDPMVRKQDMTAIDHEAAIISGAGHNAHVEKPDTVWALFASLA